MAYRNREERRRRLQKYEDRVDQDYVYDYNPFHEMCEGNVFLSDKKLIATRISGWSCEMVFSAKPIPVGGMFQVKLLEKGRGLFGTLVSAQSNLSYTLYI